MKRIRDILSEKKGLPLPWVTIKEAITSAITAKCIEIDPSGAPWPCDATSAEYVKIRIPPLNPSVTHTEKKHSSEFLKFSITPEQLYDLKDMTEDIVILQGEIQMDIKFNILVQFDPIGSSGSSSAEKNTLEDIIRAKNALKDILEKKFNVQDT